MKYDGTRHNIGFVLLDALAKKHQLNFKAEKKFKAEIALTKDLILAKPTTFMNHSGDALIKLMQFYKIPLENILIIHDDVSMETGKLRMAFNRGAGGQHGVEDIILKLGDTKAFHRLKFGVGPDPGGDLRAAYVLSKFPETQKELLEKTLGDAITAVDKWLQERDTVKQILED